LDVGSVKAKQTSAKVDDIVQTDRDRLEWGDDPQGLQKVIKRRNGEVAIRIKKRTQELYHEEYRIGGYTGKFFESNIRVNNSIFSLDQAGHQKVLGYFTYSKEDPVVRGKLLHKVNGRRVDYVLMVNNKPVATSIVSMELGPQSKFNGLADFSFMAKELGASARSTVTTGLKLICYTRVSGGWTLDVGSVKAKQTSAKVDDIVVPAMQYIWSHELKLPSLEQAANDFKVHQVEGIEKPAFMELARKALRHQAEVNDAIESRQKALELAKQKEAEAARKAEEMARAAAAAAAAGAAGVEASTAASFGSTPIDQLRDKLHAEELGYSWVTSIAGTEAVPADSTRLLATALLDNYATPSKLDGKTMVEYTDWQKIRLPRRRGLVLQSPQYRLLLVHGQPAPEVHVELLGSFSNVEAFLQGLYFNLTFEADGAPQSVTSQLDIPPEWSGKLHLISRLNVAVATQEWEKLDVTVSTEAPAKPVKKPAEEQ
jgi:hypothetical protein